MDYVRPLSNMLDICLVLEPNFTNLEDLACFESAGQKFAFLLGNAFPTNNIDAIKEFSRSLLWFTYRRNWTSPIGGFGGPVSDRGWGCMVRCGQMLLAQCLCLIHLGSKWRWNGQNQQQLEDEALTFRYRKLLRMFQDKRTAQYSIHQITQMGVSEGKQISEWLGPNTMAQVLKKLVIYDDWSNLVVHVAMDNVLISSDVWIVATQKSQNGIKIEENDEEKKMNGMDWARPLLILIPLRLGLTAINECYKEPIAEYFKLPECVGILGGRPNHAVYFYGSVGDKLLYLDPHICQEFKDLDELPAENKEMFTIPSSTTSSSSAQQYLNNNQPPSSSIQSSMTNSTSNNQNEWTMAVEGGNIAPPLQINSYNTSPCCSSNCSLEEHPSNNEMAASSSIPTSSSISKLSSQNGDCQSQSSSSSSNLDEPTEMLPIIDSFTDIGGKCADFFPDECNSNGQNESPPSIINHSSNQQSTKSETEEESPLTMTNNVVQFDDSTFHCPYLLSMDFNSLDPSLALGFLVRNSNEYANLVQNLKEKVLHKSSPPLFEILEKRPKGWPEFSLETTYLQDDSFNIKEYEDLQYDSDEQFELLE